MVICLTAAPVTPLSAFTGSWHFGWLPCKLLPLFQVAYILIPFNRKVGWLFSKLFTLWQESKNKVLIQVICWASPFSTSYVVSRSKFGYDFTRKYLLRSDKNNYWQVPSKASKGHKGHSKHPGAKTKQCWWDWKVVLGIVFSSPATSLQPLGSGQETLSK